MIQSPPQSFGLVLSHLARALDAMLPPADTARPGYDPVFLPDAFSLTPDQAQEMRYGKGRDQ